MDARQAQGGRTGKQNQGPRSQGAGATHEDGGGTKREWEARQRWIQQIKKDLKEMEGLRVDARLFRATRSLVASVEQEPRPEQGDGLEPRLQRLEEALLGSKPKSVTSQLQRIEERINKGPIQAPGVNNPTWAAVAAKSMRDAGATHAPEQKPTVRIQMPETKGKTHTEILKEVKTKIAGAAAVRVLQSGDIDVIVASQEAKDRAMAIQPSPEMKVYRRDYLIEVPGVPMSTEVDGGKAADNSRLACEIVESSKIVTPRIQITSIRWLHGDQPPRQRDAGQPQRTRGSLLIGLPTQEMQLRAIAGGIVINAEFFPTRPFERSLLATQCFRCSQWGHKASACGKPARCGQCAGPHETKECTTHMRTSCANCGQSHRAWEKRKCRAFKVYFEAIQARRYALYAQANSMAQAIPKGPDLFQMVTNKRQRDPSPTGGPRRAGRPPYIVQAASSPTQARLNFFGPDSSQADSTVLAQPAPAHLIAEVQSQEVQMESNE